MVTATKEILAHRYDQLDLHDIRRACKRMRMLVSANAIAGLTPSEVAILRNCGSIISRIRKDGADLYHVVDPQLGLWGEDAA